jgi:hypothetical protein
MQQQSSTSKKTLTILLATALVLLLATTAHAEVPAYDLQGVWESGNLVGGVKEPANGTQTVTSMNMTTGEFSGHSEVDGVQFVLKGRESGKHLEFTQSEGSYTAHDIVPTLGVLPNGHVGGNGSFEAGEFWMEVAKPAQSGEAETHEESTQSAFVTVICNTFPANPSASTCTADVGDAGATAGVTPTGTVTFTTTTGTLLGDTCSLALTPGLGSIASCTVSYQPAPETPEGVPLPVTAKYSGDAHFKPASGSTSPVSLDLATSSAKVAEDGFFTVPAVNPNGSTVTGNVTVSSAGASGARAQSAAASALAKASFTVGRLSRKGIRLKLTHAGLAKLRHAKKLAVTVLVSTRDASKHLSRRFHLTLRLR